MFGLMRAHGENPVRWRQHYCGTCKTIGRDYGQQARLLLNHDAVFLAELLTSFGDEQPDAWAPAYKPKTCATIPDEADLPAALRYTAAVTILLAESKVEDHLIDSGRRRWKWARHMFSARFRKARRQLSAFGFPVEEFDHVLARQSPIERSQVNLRQRSRSLSALPAGLNPDRQEGDRSGDPDRQEGDRSGGPDRQEGDRSGVLDPVALLDAAASPTAEVTALVFRHGARAAGAALREDELAEIGRAFGRMTYWIDAWEDYDRDIRTGTFNPLALHGLSREWAATQIRLQSRALAAALPPEFAARLRSSVEAKLTRQFKILKTCQKHSPAARLRELGASTFARVALLSLVLFIPAQAGTWGTVGKWVGISIGALIGFILLAYIADKMGCSGCCEACDCCSSCGECC